MTTEFSPEREKAIRSLLVDHAAQSQSKRRRTMWGSALLAIGLVGGLSVSTAAYAVTAAVTATSSTDRQGPAVAAPPGVIPGAPIISLLGDPISLQLPDSTRFDLTAAPIGATHIRAWITPHSPGQLVIGTDTTVNNPNLSMAWSEADLLAGNGAGGGGDFELGGEVRALLLKASDGLEATVTLQFVNHIPTHLGVNPNGETYGLGGGPDGAPDLLYLRGVSPDGTPIYGYARMTELTAELNTPAPLYEQDGQTQIGVTT